MESRVKTFWSERTGYGLKTLRRYSSATQCTKGKSYHNAETIISERAKVRINRNGYVSLPRQVGKKDPRWPTKCEACNYVFTPDDAWQTNIEEWYLGGGWEFTLSEAPPGAIYDAWWYPWKGPDGRSLIIILPDKHPWMVDWQASNCTLPNDTEHRCWIRHGDPTTGNITVDKRGRTCSAGAGSILTRTYHGFLTNGVFNP